MFLTFYNLTPVAAAYHPRELFYTIDCGISTPVLAYPFGYSIALRV